MYFYMKLSQCWDEYSDSKHQQEQTKGTGLKGWREQLCVAFDYISVLCSSKNTVIKDRETV